VSPCFFFTSTHISQLYSLPFSLLIHGYSVTANVPTLVTIPGSSPKNHSIVSVLVAFAGGILFFWVEFHPSQSKLCIKICGYLLASRKKRKKERKKKGKRRKKRDMRIARI